MPEALIPDLTPIQRGAEEVIIFIPRIVVALLIFLIFWFINRIIRRVINRYGERVRMTEEVRTLLRRVISWVVMIIGLITALGTLGVDVTALVAGLGLTGFALGFALQDIISNFLAGVLLLIHRPFRRGNYIKVGDKEGVVVDMDLRYTMLQTDKVRILIPNATLFKDSITIMMQPPQVSAPPPVPTFPPPPAT